jgi:two-component system chemotaxis response regulator CheB
MTPANAPKVSRRDLLAIGASTGGPEAIRKILAGLPTTAPPTLIVQHMPAGFTRAFAQHLNQMSPLEVREAESGDTLRPGLALIAPGGRHLRVRRSAARIDVEVVGGPLVSRHRPSVDLLFESVADAVGAGAVGVLLTGMGDDGARGMKKLKESGAVTLAQDEASAVVFGMPKAALDLGAVDEISSLDEMPAAILRHC